MDSNDDDPWAAKKPKPRRADETALRKAALSYLQRYPSSKSNLRWVLQRRLHRAQQAYGADAVAERSVIEKILDECETAGLIDDRRYAGQATQAWFNRGESVRAIKARLSQKGVASTIIDETLANLVHDNPNPDLAAAIALTRRRHLGPYRHPDRRLDYLKKDLGVLARAGFSYPLARRVLEAENENALQDLLDEASPQR